MSVLRHSGKPAACLHARNPQVWATAHLVTTTKSPGRPAGTEREPSSARSGGARTGPAESFGPRLRIRTRCEPGTARAPAAVPRCARARTAEPLTVAAHPPDIYIAFMKTMTKI